jgi:uncharacterized cupredoxin-like copper-binding protein
MKTSKLLIALRLPLALVAIAWANQSYAHGPDHNDGDIGKPGVAGKATRTIIIEMSDAMRFSPAAITVKRGETIRFVVRNSGKLKHELVLGSEKALKEHAELMKKHPQMEHADGNMVTVRAGQTGQVVWQFTEAGSVHFACLQPGHYEAGMKGLVTVAGGTTPPAPVTASNTDHAQAWRDPGTRRDQQRLIR